MPLCNEKKSETQNPPCVGLTAMNSPLVLVGSTSADSTLIGSRHSEEGGKQTTAVSLLSLEDKLLSYRCRG